MTAKTNVRFIGTFTLPIFVIKFSKELIIYTLIELVHFEYRIQHKICFIPNE